MPVHADKDVFVGVVNFEKRGPNDFRLQWNYAGKNPEDDSCYFELSSQFKAQVAQLAQQGQPLPAQMLLAQEALAKAEASL